MSVNPNLSSYYPDAFLANKSYDPDKDLDAIYNSNEPYIFDDFGDKYEVLDTISTPSGYQAYAFRDTATGQVTIAHRGSESLQDWKTNIFDIGLDNTPQQVRDAIEFNNRVITQLEQESGTVIDPSTIKQTGHSLGGGIAQLIAVMNESEAVTFNAPTVAHLIDNLIMEYPSKFANIDLVAMRDKIIEIKETDDFVANIPGYTDRLGTLIEVNTPKPTNFLYPDYLGETVKLADVLSNTASVLANLGLFLPKFIAGADGHRMGYLLKNIEAGVANSELSQLEIDQYGKDLIGILKSALESTLHQSLPSSTVSSLITSSMSLLSSSEGIFFSARGARDPLILDLDGDGVEADLIGISNTDISFDLNDDGFKEKASWSNGHDGMLFLDENVNGVVDNHSELFGYNDEVTNQIVTGTEELRIKHDLNNDGIINNSDAVFNNLRIWQDLNQDGKSQINEIKTLSDFNIKSITVKDVILSGSVIDGNSILGKGTYQVTDPNDSTKTINKELANIGLAADFTNSFTYQYQDAQGNQQGDYNLKLETLNMPLSRGYGILKSFHQAMSEDDILLNQMKGIVNSFNEYNININNDLINLNSQIEQFIFNWAGTNNINPSLMRGQFSAQKLATLENIRLIPFINTWNGNEVITSVGESLASMAWNSFFSEIKSKILLQVILKDKVSYSFAEDKIGLNNKFSLDQFLNVIKDYYGNNLNDDSATKAYFIYHLQSLSPYIVSQYQEELGAPAPDNFKNKIKETFGYNVDNLIIGSDGNDTNPINQITKDNNYYSNEIFNLGKGDDTIFNDNIGDDIYIYNKGDGKDTIAEYSYYTRGTQIDHGNDKIILGPGISKEDVYFSKDVNNYSLIIKFKNSPNDQIEIGGHLINGACRIETLEFSNKETINLNNFPNLTFTIDGDDTNNSQLSGTDYNDILNGKKGDDVISGGWGNDIYLYNKGDGKDIIIESNQPQFNTDYGNDKIIFGEEIKKEDIYFSKNNSDLIIKFRNNPNDQITIQSHLDGRQTSIVETLQFSDGSIISLKLFDIPNIKFTFEGDNADNSIIGSEGDDTIIAGKGDDFIGGRAGNDAYIFNKGDGKDTINESYYSNASGNNDYGQDKIILGSEIKPSDVYFTIVNHYDLVINFKNNDTDKITIKNQFAGLTNTIEDIEFSFDNSLLKISDLQSLTFGYEGTVGDDIIFGSNYNDILNGKKGDDVITGSWGNDTYLYNKGDGKDIFAEYNSIDEFNYPMGTDNITLGADIVKSDVYFTKFINDLIINFRNNSSDQITIKNQFRSLADHIETLAFSDNSTIDISNPATLVLTSIYEGTDADDIINGSASNDIINGKAGNDNINSENGNDTITGGLGDDVLGSNTSGNSGDDTYIFNNGDGKDTIYEYGANSGSTSSYGADKIIFGENIKKEDIYLSKNNSDLIIKFKDNNLDQITIKNHFRSQADIIETLVFSNGDIVDISAEGTNVNDIINGSNSNDIINAKAGDDVVFGAKGDDTYIYNKGDGKDIIGEVEVGYSRFINYGTDKIIFGEGIKKEDILLSYSVLGADLIIKFKDNNSDQIIIKNQLRSESDRIETLVFNNGDIIDISQPPVSPLIYEGMDSGEEILSSDYDDIINAGAGDDYIYANYGNDIIKASDGNDTIDAGPGDDIIIGGKGDDILGNGSGNYGDDTYIYNKGDGKDTIYEYYAGSYNDKIVFGADIARLDVYFTVGTNQSDLVINFRNSPGDQITINEQFESTFSRIESIEFANGDAAIDISNPYALTLEYLGTNGNDTFYSWRGHSIINSGAGNDTIVTGSFNDTINAGTGNDYIYANDGNDIINAGTGKDRITGGKGDDIISGNGDGDTYFYNKGDGKDIIIDFGSAPNAINFIQNADSISFGEDIKMADILLSKSGNDLIIKFVDNDLDQITVQNHFKSLNDRVESLSFFDGGGIDISDPAMFVYHSGYYNVDETTINGSDFNDMMNGDYGNDTIDAKAGNDKLNGGDGIDTLIGGSGNDSFIFDSIESSNNSNPDLIMDFIHGEDLIDFSAISSINSISDLNITNDGVNTLIDDQNSDFAVKLSGIKLLAADDFMFHG